MKRIISLLLCAVLLLGNFPVTVRAEEALPECNGSSDCSAESHAEGCEKAAADKAAADQATADAVDALVAELPALADIQAKPMEEAGAEYDQVNAAYDAYMALTDDQKALLAYGEELFLPYLQYFSGAPQEENQVRVRGLRLPAPGQAHRKRSIDIRYQVILVLL